MADARRRRCSAVLLALELGWALSRTSGLACRRRPTAPASSVGRASSATVLFTDYMFAFEVTSILIIVVDGRRRRAGAEESRVTRACPLEPLPRAVGAAVRDRHGRRVPAAQPDHAAAVGRDHAERRQPDVRRVRPRSSGTVDGQIITFFVMTVAAAEAAVGLALVIALFRHRESLNPEAFTSLKW